MYHSVNTCVMCTFERLKCQGGHEIFQGANVGPPKKTYAYIYTHTHTLTHTHIYM